jgi:hypothetical protein
MRYVMENIEAEKLPGEMKRRGIPPRQRLRVVVETLDDSFALATAAEQGGAFAFLAQEPDIYREADIKRPNV